MGTKSLSEQQNIYKNQNPHKMASDEQMFCSQLGDSGFTQCCMDHLNSKGALASVGVLGAPGLLVWKSMAQNNCNAGQVDTSIISETLVSAHQAQNIVSEKFMDMHGSKVPTEAVYTALGNSFAALSAPLYIRK